MQSMTASDTPARDDHAAFDGALATAVEALGLRVGQPERERMWRHFQMVVEANRRFNLTRITAPAEAAVKHYADALTLLRASELRLPAAPRVLDVGTGAGFPAIPLAIVCPAWRITAIDGTGRKAAFVAACAAELQLNRVSALHSRAAELAREAGAAFDLVLLRAVARLEAGLNEVHRLVPPGGWIVFYKTRDLSAEEHRPAAAAARRLGFQEQPHVDLTLPLGDALLRRRLVVYRRVSG